MVRIPDLLAARKANKRMMKLSKLLQRDPTNRDLKAEMWLRCDEFKMNTSAAFGWNLPEQALTDLGDANTLTAMIEAELGRGEIAARIEHLDPMRARHLRENPTGN